MASQQILFANNAQSTLAGPISNTATTINLAAGTGVLFPVPGLNQIFKITLVSAQNPNVDEIVNVTAISGDVVTVQRGQEGTTAQSFIAGDFAYNFITAASLGNFVQFATQSSSFYEGTDTGTPNAVNVPTLTPSLSVPAAGQLFLIIKGTASNTGAVSMQINGGTSFTVVYKDGSPLNQADWPANAAALLYFTGSVYQFLSCQASTPMGSLIHFAADAGSVNAMVGSFVPPVSALIDGSVYEITPAYTNTGATTLNANGLGAQSVVRGDGTAIQQNDIKIGVRTLLTWNASLSAFEMIGVITSAQPPKNLVSFTSHGTFTWTVPAGIYVCYPTVVGAGGGGAGAAGASSWSGGGGGSGGGTAIGGPTLVTPGQNITIIVGAGGDGLSARQRRARRDWGDILVRRKLIRDGRHWRPSRNINLCGGSPWRRIRRPIEP